LSGFIKNANVFVDVDLTLVDMNQRLLLGAKESLEKLRASGGHLFLWEHGGTEYARKIAAAYGLTDLFEGFTAKPDIIINDTPGSTHAPFAYAVTPEDTWPQVVDDIIRKHVD
jgi:phosphoglycolate phosphatase-like HAD superfamily hydrolase